MHDKLDFHDSIFDKLSPLFEYFRLLRNCYAHAEGIANRELEEYAQTEKLLKSFDYWNSHFARLKAPTLPKIERGSKLEVKVTHSILSSAVNYKLATILNRRAVELLDLVGLVRMAAYYSLFIEQSTSARFKYRTAESAVTDFLSSRYLVKNLSSADAIQILKNLELWGRCQTQFKEIATA